MDFRLTDQQLELQRIARRFAYEEIQPRARELDKAVDPRDAYPTDLVRRASELGLRLAPDQQAGHAVLTQRFICPPTFTASLHCPSRFPLHCPIP